MTTPAKPPAPVIVAQQAALRDRLPFSDTADFEDASRGLIERLEPCVVRAADLSLDSSRASLPALALGSLDADSLAKAGIQVSGDAGVLARLAAVLDGGDPDFAIVTPE